MNKAAILKILLISTVPFVVLTLLIFFLYPYINKEGYQKIVEEFEAGVYINEADSNAINLEGLEESMTIVDSLIASAIGTMSDSADVSLQEFNILKIEKVKLQSRVDSLLVLVSNQRNTIREQGTRLQELEATAVNEDFVVRVKSMLNLEVEELAPILRKFDDDELVKIYLNSGSMQREKILRSLDPAKAADLMSEVML